MTNNAKCILFLSRKKWRIVLNFRSHISLSLINCLSFEIRVIAHSVIRRDQAWSRWNMIHNKFTSNKAIHAPKSPNFDEWAQKSEEKLWYLGAVEADCYFDGLILWSSNFKNQFRFGLGLQDENHARNFLMGFWPNWISSLDFDFAAFALQ